MCEWQRHIERNDRVGPFAIDGDNDKCVFVQREHRTGPESNILFDFDICHCS